MSEKLCAFCKNFDWERVDYHYYSTLTGGDMTGGMSCKAGHFCSRIPYDSDDFRNTILQANTCKDYTPPEVAK